MFRIRSITLYKGTDKRTLTFSDNAYVYGHNNVGKTALTKIIDYVLGRSAALSHDGLDNIEQVGAYIVNDNTELWIKRSLFGEYYYKRTVASEYSMISSGTYKDIICEVITEKLDDKAIKVYRRVFEENPSFRSFSFLNFVDEVGQGDLGSIFTRGKETRHFVRIRKIMDFFFNYENIENLYEREIELDKLENEQKALNDKIQQFQYSAQQIRILFTKLGWDYSDEMSDNYTLFQKYQHDYSREKPKSSGDLVYLTKASHALSEEIKMYTYIRNQSKKTESRKERTEHLLSILQSIIADNEEYAEDVDVIVKAISEIQQDRVILSIADYDKSIIRIEEEKKKIDNRIALLKSQAKELNYEQTMKAITLLEENFRCINSMVDISRASILTKEIADLRRKIKELKNNYSQKTINDFNARLTDLYLNSSVQNVRHLDEDRNDEGFSLVFDPFTQSLVANHKEGDYYVSFTPGSMARHNHLQLLVYLCMLEHLHNHFSDFFYLPILIIDSADQSMEDQSFNEIYPSLVEMAKEIGVQTIFISKYKPTTVDDKDLVDISGGLNPFHQRKELN